MNVLFKFDYQIQLSKMLSNSITCLILLLSNLIMCSILITCDV